jgi:diguanylate cyclase (GGDEF)-like protein/PAS domain S-box-containing protein
MKKTTAKPKKRSASRKPFAHSAARSSDNGVSGTETRPLSPEERSKNPLETQLRIFVLHAPVAAAMFDRDMHYITASRRWLEVLGKPGHDVVGLSHYEVFPRTSTPLKQVYERCLTGAREAREIDSFLREDGSAQWIKWQAAPWFEEENKNDSIGGIIVIAEDVSDRKKIEESGRRSVELFRRLLESVPDGMVIVNSRGEIVMVNDHFQQMTGYLREELQGRPIELLVPEASVREHVLSRNEYLKNPTARPMGDRRDLLCCRKDGTSFPAEISLSPLMTEEGTMVITAIRNITIRKRALQEASQLAAIVASSNDAIIGMGLDGVIISWNRGAERVYGYSAEEVVGKPVFLLTSPEQPDNFQRILERVGSGEQVGHYEAVRIRKDGRRIDVFVTISPVRDITGRIVGASNIARDITELKKAESAERLAAAVFASTTEGIMVTDKDSVIQSVNKAFEQITGYSEAEVKGQTPRILKSGLQDASFYVWMWKTLRETGMWKGNFWNRRKNGVIYPQETTINAIRNERGEIMQYCGIFRDITEQYRLEETLRTLSTTDGLTGLANRRSFDESIESEWRRAQRIGYSLAIIMADIDDFKRFNDTYGHLEGDECLKKVALVFKTAVRRAGDLAARFGGEEFVLLLPMTRVNEAGQIAEEIRLRIEALKMIPKSGAASVRVTISMGVSAAAPKQEVSAEGLLTMADQALYQAKREGKNRVVIAGA